MLMKLLFSSFILAMSEKVILIEYQKSQLERALKIKKNLQVKMKIPNDFIQMNKLRKPICKKSYFGVLYLCLRAEEKTVLYKKEDALQRSVGQFRRL